MTFPPVDVSGVRVLPAACFPSIRAELSTLLAEEDGAPPDRGDAAENVLSVDVVGIDGIDDLLPRALDRTRRGGLHLPVVVHEGHTSVGPLTTPGYSACVQCAAYRGLWEATMPRDGAEGPGSPADLPPLTARLVSVTAAQEIERITRRTGTLPLTLGGMVQVDHTTGTVGIENVSQIDGCEMCAALIECVLQGVL
ncbi:TOMM precursor leader peptide-binding protein [Streptomyces sp. PRKS01-65]|nr:TOMM precursor leader peptide-binding protein [Streptomyces harenosi]NEY32868.1 TOMM precursor leader peptide-binding protein [Streptomyces harenosi]